MQEKVTIDPKYFIIDAFRDQSIDNEEEFRELLTKEYSNKICSLLTAYGDLRGSVEYFEIAEETLHINDNMLSFYLNYDEYVYLGCRDQNYMNEDLVMKIELRKFNNEYIFYGEYRAERSEEDI